MIIFILLAVLLFLLLIALGGGIILYRTALHAKKRKRKASDELPPFYTQHEKEVIVLTARDGIRLSCDFFPCHGSHRYAILCHGYKGRAENMALYAEHFYKRGFSILLPAARGHGESEGHYIGMGYHERLDIADYCTLLTERDAHAEILLFGVSMGGATVMLTLGEPLPQNVRCAIEDCGYTSAWEELSLRLVRQYHLPRFPFLYTANLITKICAGYSFRHADAEKALTRAKIPLLLIHGGDDDFVPTEMVYRLYDAARCEKRLLVVPNAKHAVSAEENPTLYFETVDDFISRYFI